MKLAQEKPIVFDACELVRCAAVLSKAAAAGEHRWTTSARRLVIVFYQDTGHFQIKNDVGVPCSLNVLYQMYPELREDALESNEPLATTTPVETTAS